MLFLLPKVINQTGPDKNWTRLFHDNVKTISVNFGEIVYGRIQVDETAEDLKIRLKKCYATPTDNKGNWCMKT